MLRTRWEEIEHKPYTPASIDNADLDPFADEMAQWLKRLRGRAA